MYQRVYFLFVSDVVYDPSIIPSLVNILHVLLDRNVPNGNKPTAYIASTIRNCETRDLFLEGLGVHHFTLNYTTVIMVVKIGSKYIFNFNKHSSHA